MRAAAGPGVELVRFKGGDRGQRYDVLPLTVLTASMAETVGVDRRRFRPNIVIAGADGLDEADWPGYGLRAGGVVIGVRNRRTRCVMTTFDPDTLEQDPGVLRRIVRSFGGEVALDCWVVEPGRIAEGDAVELVELDGACRAAAGQRLRAVHLEPAAARLATAYFSRLLLLRRLLDRRQLRHAEAVVDEQLATRRARQPLDEGRRVGVVLRVLDDRDLVADGRLRPGRNRDDLDLVGDRAARR